MAEFWYNTSFHTSAGMSPHEALYGEKPVPMLLGSYSGSVIPAAGDMLQQRADVLRALKENLSKAQNRMKVFADRKRTERQFKAGDWVYLKLQPFKQQSVAVRSNLKLSSRFYGPFQVVEKIGTVAYKLRLPDHARIHPVFHVSLLKKQIGPLPISPTELPALNEADVCSLEPEATLQRRSIMRNGQRVVQWLIKWKGLEREDASWEDQTFIQN